MIVLPSLLQNPVDDARVGALLLAAPFVIAFLATAAVTPLVRAGARRWGFVARPRGDRWHQTPTALLGGIAIFIGCTIAVGVAAIIGQLPSMPHDGLRGDTWLLGIVLSAGMMFLTGVADDIWKFRPAAKLVLQVVAAAILVSAGVVLPLLPWTTANIVVTLVWFIFLTNALNLLDNMDGVAVGVGGIAALFLAIAFALQAQWVLAATALALAGAAAGFLPYNFNRASIFMGDSGSLFIGALLAGLSAAFPAGASQSVFSVMFVPALIVIIPIADTMLVSTTRTLAGLSVTVGGRDHTTHRLVAMGLSERQVALVLYAFSAVGGTFAIVLQRSQLGYGLWTGVLFLIALLTAAAYLSRLHSYPAEQVRNSPRFTVIVTNLLYKGRLLEASLDLVLFCLAYYGAYLLRYEGAVPASQLAVFQKTLAVVLASYLGGFALVGVYRGAWQQASLADLHRVVRGVILGTVITATALVMIYRTDEFSRSVLVINALAVTLLTLGARASFRTLETLHRGRAAGREPTLIYGAGKAGELLVRELRANARYGLNPVGFIDDDPHKQGLLVYDLPVVGGVGVLTNGGLPPRVTTVLVGTAKLTNERLRTLQDIAAARQLKLLGFDLVIRQLDRPVEVAAQPASTTITEEA